MQVLKKDIRGRILTVARQQFKRKGQFHDFHARNSGVDRCWRWKHLQLLHEQRWIVPQVVCPVFRAWEAMLQEDHGIRNEDIMMMRLEEYLKAYIDEYVSLIDKYLVLMEILLFRAQGSSLEHSSIGAIRRSWFCYKLVIFVSLHKYRLFGRISAEFIPPQKMPQTAFIRLDWRWRRLERHSSCRRSSGWASDGENPLRLPLSPRRTGLKRIWHNTQHWLLILC